MILFKLFNRYTFGKPVTGKLELNVSLGHRNEYTISKVMDVSMRVLIGMNTIQEI